MSQSDEIQRAVRMIRAGQCVAFPTETVYGLGADATNPAAVARVFSIKKRPRFDPLIVHIGAIEQIESVAMSVDDRALSLARAFWPGPLTLVVPKAPMIDDIVTAGLPEVAVRMPDHPLALELLRRAAVPIAAPSANPFGYVSPTTAEHVRRQLGDAVDLILDGGPCRVGLESTIVSLGGDRPALLRPGGVALEEIEAHLETRLETRLETLGRGRRPLAPGQLPRHYSPVTRLVIVATPQAVPPGQRTTAAILSVGPVDDIAGFARTEILSADSNLEQAAAKLYAAMRDLDNSPVDAIYAIAVDEVGLGRAIMDRLRRAAEK